MEEFDLFIIYSLVTFGVIMYVHVCVAFREVGIF